MFEGAVLLDVGRVNDSSPSELGFRLRLPDDRLITVTGLTADECREIASLFGEFVVFGLTAK